MTTVRVPVSHDVLVWAIQRTQKSLKELAEVSDLRKIEEWLDGTTQPTLNQADTLAKKAGIPFGYLVLPAPVDTTPDLPDFRTRKNSRIKSVSPELEEQIALCQERLDWYIDNVAEYGTPGFKDVASATTGNAPRELADIMRATVGWEPGRPVGTRTHINVLADALEDCGVLVMKSSYVGNRTNARLDSAEFSGFTLIKAGFALIFINTRETATANLFSLAHEFGHVLLGKQGVSSSEEHNSVERWCNTFAAQFLAPQELLIKLMPADHEVALDTVRGLAAKFGVSVEMMAWRLTDTGMLERAQARALIGEWNAIIHHNNDKDRKNTGGLPPHINARAKLGTNFLSAIAEAYESGAISYRDAARFTGYKKVDSLENALGLHPQGV